MVIDFKLNSCEEIELLCGKTYLIESITHAVTPQNFLVAEEMDIPSEITLLKIEPLEGEGVIGNVYMVEAKVSGATQLISSLKNLKTGDNVKSKTVKVLIK